jgi:hypothetical protein
MTRQERIRQQARAIEAALHLNDDAPRFGGLGRREYQPHPVEDKSKARAILADAARNTARLQGE